MNQNNVLAQKILNNDSIYDNLDILLKNKDNEELFDILLSNEDFISDLRILKENLSKFGNEIQKKILLANADLNESLIFFKDASENIRNDEKFIESLVNTYLKRAYYVPDGMVAQINYAAFEKDIDSFIYENLGKKLINNKEFLLRSKEISPITYIKNAKLLQLTKEELKTFFESHSYLIKYVPDYLLEDSDFLYEIIGRLGHSNFYNLGDLGFKKLSKEKIKNIIINYFGWEEYSSLLLNRLKFEHNRIFNLSYKDLVELILLNPESSDIYESNIFDLDFSEFLTFVLNIKKEQLLKVVKRICTITLEKINTPELLSKELYKLSKVLEMDLKYDYIHNKVKENWVNISSWINGIDDYYEKYDDTIHVQENNNVFFNIYNLLVGIKSNKLPEFFTIFDNTDFRSSRYGKYLKNININDFDIAFIKLICNTKIIASNMDMLKLFNELFIKVNDISINPQETVQFITLVCEDQNIINLIKNSDLVNMEPKILSNLYTYIMSGVNCIYKINSLEELNNVSVIIKNSVDILKNKKQVVLFERHVHNVYNFSTRSKKDDLVFDDISAKKNIILLKYFEMNLEKARLIFNSYLSSSEQIYKDIPELQILKEELYKIINGDNLEELNDIETDLEKNNFNFAFKEMNYLIMKIKRKYGTLINESLFNAEQDGVIDITDSNFNLLVHVLGAYGQIPSGEIYDAWNTKEKINKVSICTSFISNSNMGIARADENSVILGFNNLPEDFLELMSNTDLYSQGFRAYRNSNFMGPKALENNTRHSHNELTIRRTIGKYSNEKIQPSYIICFDNINDKSKEAAEQFKIPILFIDRQKVAQNNYNQLINDVREFCETLNPELISKIIVGQENNRSGLRLSRPDLAEKYFSTEIRQNNINAIYNAIINNQDNPNIVNCMNEFVTVFDEESKKYIVKNETKNRKNSYDIDFENMVKSIKENKMYNESISSEKTLSQQEVYERFLLLRKELSDKEKIELEQIKKSETKKVG